MFFMAICRFGHNARALLKYSLHASALCFAMTILVTYTSFASPAKAATEGLSTHSDSAQKAIQMARQLKLADEKKWKLILYYYPSWLGERSIVDGGMFFLSPDGAKSPDAELEATLSAFFATPKNTPEKDSPLCLYPMRAHWLASKLTPLGIQLPVQHCPEYEKFFQAVDPVSVTMLFSSFYPNNPGSLFGHTFLRMNSKSSMQNPSSAHLLDLGIGFSAFPTTQNPFLYPILGLGGGFPGRFDLTPFYAKVQEYNHSENRDLWEYELNIDQEGSSDIIRSVYELRASRIDYYYFDDNCAYILLQLLEIAKPSLELRDKFNGWVIPGDTIRVVAGAQGLIKDIRYRPSIFRRFQSLHQRLSPDQAELLEMLVQEEIELEDIDVSNFEKAQIIDTFLEFIDFDERLAGSKESVKWAESRKKALTLRAKLGQTLSASELERLKLEIPLPENERPELAHPPTRVTFGLGIVPKSRDGYLEVAWRPALHDLGSRQVGYSKELEIQFFNPIFRLYQKDRRPLLQEFNLLRILAANPDAPLMPQVAWSVYLGMDRNLHRNRPREFLQVGAGKATSFGNSAARAYLLALADLGYEAKLGLHAGPGIRVGAVTPFFAETKIRVDTTLTRNFGLRSNETSIAGRAQLGKSFGQEFELNLRAERSNAEASFSILIHKYF
jgi:hypothetical protein